MSIQQIHKHVLKCDGRDCKISLIVESVGVTTPELPMGWTVKQWIEDRGGILGSFGYERHYCPYCSVHPERQEGPTKGIN